MRVLTSSVAMMRNELLRVILLVSVLADLVNTQQANDAQDDAQRSEELQRHLELGRKLLAAGQLNDALDQYHRTVELDSSSHLNYFRRATVYIAMGRPKNAYSDLSRSLELSPDFVGAYMQRGNLLIKMGQFVEARADFMEAVQRGDQAANERLAYSEEMIRKVEEIESLRNDPRSLVDAYSRLIEAAPFSSDLRMARADAYLLVDDPKLAVIDLRAVARIVPDSTDLFARISQIMYQSGDLNDALNEIRECVKLDQEHKICKPEYRRLKKIAKIAEAMDSAQNGEKWEECITEAERLRNEETAVRVYQMRADLASCHCMSRIAKRASDAIRTCTKYLDDYDSANTDALLDRAEAYVTMDQLDSAKADYSKILEHDSQNQRAKEGMERVQKLVKQRGKRDYYKILGVARNANKQEITKAYRNLAQEWHPDNFQDETEKKAAEKKFIEIAAAKEVLTDPEKRKQFDQGIDPLDPESQQQGGHGNPFAQGFNPFGFGGFNPFGGGGGNYQFKFHFN